MHDLCVRWQVGVHVLYVVCGMHDCVWRCGMLGCGVRGMLCVGCVHVCVVLCMVVVCVQA